MTARGIRLQSSELLKSTSAYVRRSKTNLVGQLCKKAHHVLLALALQFFCRYRPISRKLHEYCYSMGAPPIQNSRALDDYLREADPLFDNNSLENLLRTITLPCTKNLRKFCGAHNQLPKQYETLASLPESQLRWLCLSQRLRPSRLLKMIKSLWKLVTVAPL